MEGRLQRKISIAIIFDKRYVRSVIEERDSKDWEIIKKVLGYMGWDIKFVYVAFGPAIAQDQETNLIYFPRYGKQEMN